MLTELACNHAKLLNHTQAIKTIQSYNQLKFREIRMLLFTLKIITISVPCLQESITLCKKTVEIRDNESIRSDKSIQFFLLLKCVIGISRMENLKREL